jgi:arylsulfatase A-like enzyme
MAAASLHAQPRRRPNIVMILCDDLGYSDLGCYGNRVIQTPRLDDLASRGTRFTQFYSASPVCTPTRAALMTGHHPHHYGIHHADLPEALPRYPLPATAVTITEVLKGAGYYTAHVGKWHLGEPPETVEPRQQGLDYFFGCLGGRPSSPWIRYARSMDPEIVVNENRPVMYKGHVTDVQTQAAIDAIEKAPRDRPFYLNLWYNAPHEPLAPLAHQKNLYASWSAEEQTYFQTVSDVDRCVGQVVDKLSQLGLTDNTLIAFSSDNGPEAHSFKYSRGSAWPLKGMKTQLWEGGIRVPGFLVSPGRIPAARISTEPAHTLDLFPTFCAAAGIKPPAGLHGGVDLIQVANGKTSTRERPLFWEFHAPQRGVAASLPMCVRRNRWKLFANHDLSRVELYDLEADAGEQRDVASQHPAVVAELKQVLDRWWSQYRGKADISNARQPVPVPSPEELEKKHYKN